ncbi:MAG: hypothetical protein NTV22_15965 [bacterium]|nr:hypothetical protein [bacterium]
MNTLCPRAQRLLVVYLSLAMLLGAQDAVQCLCGAAAVVLDLAAHSMPRAYANKEPDNHMKWAHSKPAIWVNYADPRPKGKDADKGAQPAWYPAVSVNNVSLMPAVQQSLLNIVTPAGALDLSIALSYSPPLLTYSDQVGYNIAASPSPFGHCWSDSLTPAIEESEAPNGSIWEHALQVSGGNLPSASLKYENNSWVPDPLTKASYADNAVSFWQSGIRMPKGNFAITNYDGNSYTIYNWPTAIYDRNTNGLFFAYDGYQGTLVSLNDIVYVPKIKTASNFFGQLSFVGETIAYPYHVMDVYHTNYVYRTTSIAATNDGGSARAVTIEYLTENIVINGSNGRPLDLISRILFPDGSTCQFNYTSISLLENIALPYLTSIITPADTIHITYGNWAFGTPPNGCDTSKCEPATVTVISGNGTATQQYNRINGTTTKTISDTGTENIKIYQLNYLARNMQWYGCETDNTLDGLKQYEYGIDQARFLYTSVKRFPVGGSTLSDTSTFAYDDHDNLISATDPYNNNTCYFYAPNKLDQTCVSDPRGVISSNIYDACGNLLITIEDCGDDTFNRTSSNLYNTAGQVIKSFDPLGRISRSFYCINQSAGPVSSYDNEEPLASVCGFLVATRDAEDRVTTYSYDALGRQIVVNAPGNSDSARYAITNTYDIMDRTTATRFPDGTYVSNVFNAAGYPVRVRDRAGRWTENTYDAAGHLVRVDYPNNDWVKKEYTGNLVSKLMDAAANTTEYFYCHEQLTGVRFPDGSTRAAGFDNFNRQIWAVDERGIAVTNAYDKLDRVIASAYVPYQDGNTVAGLPYTTTVGITPSTCNWSLIYGGFDNQVISYAYDKVGNVTNLADWAGTLTNAYDRLNRPVFSSTQFCSSPSLLYSLLTSYDLADNCTTQDFVSDYLPIKTTYTYDSLNRLANVLSRPRALEIYCSYTYNDNGKVAWKRYYQSGTQIVLQFHSYDTENRLVSIIGGGHRTVTYQYNNAQQISGMNETISGTERRFVYEYDNRDQLTEETEWLNSGEWEEGPPNTYCYDNAQNRVSAVTTGQGIHEYYGYSIANKMTNIWRGSQSASSRYWYDLAGNLSTSIVKNVTNCYYYNVQNKLVKIAGTNFVNEFRYNSRNERIAVGIGPSTNSLVWRYDACQGPVTLAEFNSNNQMTRWYVRGLGIAAGIGDVIAEVEVLDAPKPHYYLSNHRGDTLVVLNPDGAANSTFRYDAFGNCYEKAGTFTPRYKFSTKEYLPDAKLYLYAYRVYDPIAGRWTQKDPIDYQDSINLYQFCGNNPFGKLDPDGRMPLFLAVAGVIVIPLGVGVLGYTQCADPINDQSINDCVYEGHTALGIVGRYKAGDNQLMNQSAFVHEQRHMRDWWQSIWMRDWRKERRAWTQARQSLVEGIESTMAKGPLTEQQQKYVNEAQDRVNFIDQNKLTTEEGAKRYVEEQRKYGR